MEKIRRALVSLFDKTGVVDFVKALCDMGVEILSTGGTARTLREAGLEVKDVSGYTGFPEMLDGRVKTLHPKIHGGLLAKRDDPGHMEDIKRQGIEPIGMVVVNLYPFEAAVSKPDVKLQDAIENIDIGGPAMLRSAAKNFESVVVVVDPDDYGRVMEEMKNLGGSVSYKTRMELARKVFGHTSRYDAHIHEYFSKITRAEE